MYKDYYQLDDYPFSLTLDSKFLYWSQQHQNAFRHLVYGIQSQRSLTMLAGDVGTGKTTLLNTLVEFLQTKAQSRIISVANSKITTEALLYYILSEVGLQVDKGEKIDYLITLQRFLLENAERGKKVVLILDEAQNYSHDSLEEIRLLSNIETSKDKLIQIILAGQPHLLKNISDPNMYQLKQRMGVIYNLKPLNQMETGSYIQKRLEVSGANGRMLFHEKAIEDIYHHSMGIPRVINLICDNALLYGHAMKKSQINTKIVQQVAEDMGLIETQLSDREFLHKRHQKLEEKQKEDEYDDVILEYTRNYINRLSDESSAGSYYLQYKYAYGDEFNTKKSCKFIIAVLAIIPIIAILAIFFFSEFSLLEYLPRSSEKLRSMLNISDNGQHNPNSAVHQDKETLLSSIPSTLEVIPNEKLWGNDHHDNKDEPSRFDEPVSIESDGHPARDVIVNEGDTFAKILMREYGEYNEDVVASVIEANPDITDMNTIFIGQRIRLPKRKRNG